MTTLDADLRHIAAALMVALLVVAAYHRIRSQLGGESLDRRREGWGLLIGIRLAGLAGAVTVVMALRDSLGAWAYMSLPVSIRWSGIATLAASVAWLSWMFVSLGRNLDGHRGHTTNGGLCRIGPVPIRSQSHVHRTPDDRPESRHGAGDLGGPGRIRRRLPAAGPSHGARGAPPHRPVWRSIPRLHETCRPVFPPHWLTRPGTR